VEILRQVETDGLLISEEGRFLVFFMGRFEVKL
jgi:hypothetical protein